MEGGDAAQDRNSVKSKLGELRIDLPPLALVSIYLLPCLPCWPELSAFSPSYQMIISNTGSGGPPESTATPRTVL
uniref:Uncharacterized protein n=1 Tax=Picea glauca TaxID=3330 RepID=A0A117NIW4_PICGL|nr:hypothetical protein ABT39_MTgene461 [Picea glauca]QHR88178.1 hypothetical protein Q903MT_gene2191 [Picea sitchensis]